MSYSICLKCKEMVPFYDKYCKKCQQTFSLPNIPDFQKEWTPEGSFEESAEQEVKKDINKSKI